MTTTTFYASTDHLEAFLAQHARPAAPAAMTTPPESPPPPSDPVPGSLTGYQPSLAPKRMLVPLRPKSIRWTGRGVVLVVAAVALLADVGWWWWHRGG